MKRLLASFLFTTACLAQAPNMFPVGGQYCVLDSNTNPTAVYQYGDGAKLWGQTFTNPTLPLIVNYTNAPLLGIPSTWSGPLPTTLYVQQTNVVQTIKVHNLDPASWTVTVPALPVVTPAVSATPTAAIPATPVTGTAVIPDRVVTFTVPRNGGSVSVTIKGGSVPVTATTNAVQAPLSLSGLTGTFTCNIPPSSTVITNPDGSHTVTGASCTVVTK